MADALLRDFEVKFKEGAPVGEFEGYASVYGNEDSHGDVVEAGAFKDSLAERKAQGRAHPPLHIMHGLTGGLFSKGIPAGVWTRIEEDSKGLAVTGKISGAANTDAGRLIYEKVKDGALAGLSIGYSKRPNGVIYGKAAGEPKRRLKSVNLQEISLVDDPSNPQTLVTSIKAKAGDADKAATSIAAAMRLHDKSMGDGYSYSSPRDKAQLMNHLRDAHLCLTGASAPDDLDAWKSIARDEFEAGVMATFGLDAIQAKRLADHALGEASPMAADDGLKSALSELGSLSDFKLI